MKRPTPKHIKNKPSTPWMVRIPNALVLPDENGKKPHARKFFKTRDDALEYIHRLFNPLIGPVKADWREHVVEYGKVSVSRCVSDFLTLRYRPEQTKNNRTLVQERQILGAFVKRYRNTPIDGLTHREIDSWLRGIEKAPVTKLNYYRITKRFFKWCHEKQEVIDRNPMLKVDEPRVEHQEPDVLTPEQMRICLDTAKDTPALLAHLTLGAFAGVRTEEVLRMSWEDINWNDGIVRIRQPKKVTRWRPRDVEILPALRRHLEPVALASGPIFAGGEQQLCALRAPLVERLGLKRWPSNCLRHSYASYHVPIYNDYPALAIQMGHSTPTMTRYKYGTLCARTIASRWWTL